MIAAPPTGPRSRWVLPPATRLAQAKSLAARSGLPVSVWRLLLGRGIETEAEAETFLAPGLEQLHDPMGLADMGPLVARLAQAIAEGELIGIHGDYDVDGLTSTALYARVLRRLGAKVLPFVPHRMIDGYGVSERAIGEFAAAGVQVVLTCDTGFSAHAAVKTAVETHGLTVLVTDHHLGGDEMPVAQALVNPHRPDNTYPFKDLCGVGVAFKVCQALCAHLGVSPRTTLYVDLDLVALGTVADVMPLKDENRVFVTMGLKMLRQTRNVGLKALLDVTDTPPEKIHEGTLGWVLGPRLNAVGRIDDAAQGLDLLLCEDPVQAKAMAQQIHERNEARRALTKRIEEHAIEQLEAIDWSTTWGLALFGPDPVPPDGVAWHHGVIGIVASRLVERTGRPVFLFAKDEASGKWKGSGRCPVSSGAHLKHALDALRDEFLVAGGGHAAAAGATLADGSPEGRVAFAARFNAIIAEQVGNLDALTPVLALEGATDLADLAEDVFWKFLKPCGPFGMGNPDPIWLVQSAELLNIGIIGKEKIHAKLRVRQGGQTREVLCWRFTDLYPGLLGPDAPRWVDLCVQLKEDTWQGERRLQILLLDAQPAAAGQGALVSPSGSAGASARPAYLPPRDLFA